jgi:hypothetical protein
MRDQVVELDIPFDNMITSVRFADGREIKADRGIQLE